MKIITLLISLALPVPAATFNVRDYGAKGDGKSLDTDAIQKTVKAAADAGGGVVIIPEGRFLTGPFTLASRINLHLDSNAIILVDNDLSRYPIAGKRYQDTITVSAAHDVQISGSGVIDGQGDAWWQAFRADPTMTHRPYLIKISDCTNVTVTGVTLRNSPMFHLVTQNCTDVVIDGITIHSPANAPNTDGIDPSGWNFLIANCDIDTGDDNIAIKPAPSSGRKPGNKNYLVENCTFGHGHGMSVGGGSAGGLEDLVVTNCTFHQTDYGIRIKTVRGNGGKLQHCVYTDLTMSDIAKSPISIMDYYPERNAPDDPATEKAEPVNERTPFNQDIVIRNVTATNCPNAGIIRGLPEAPIEGLTFSNVTLAARTGMKIYHANGVRFENAHVIADEGKPLTAFDAATSGLK